MLSFLNTKKKANRSRQNQQLPESTPGPSTMKPSISMGALYNQAKPGPSATRTSTPQQLPTQETQLNDPDANFLFSILPDMKSMDPTQNFEFRFQVMKLIKDLKYNQPNSNYYVYCDQGSSTFTTHVPKYASKTISEQEIEVDPISNDTAVSSPEDRKVIELQDFE